MASWHGEKHVRFGNYPVNNRSKSAAAAEDDADPYRWLEDSASPETAAWVTAQNERTQAYLASVPAREVNLSRLTERWDFPRSGVPFERGWSRADRIAINGGSNGGLLVGACLTQHPELSGAAVADVGVFDMLRFHRFTVGRLWKDEYGDPEDPEQYRWLRRYSPLHNVRPRNYPATLLTTGDHDDRVVPGHSFKFAAALQEAQRPARPSASGWTPRPGTAGEGRPRRP